MFIQSSTLAAARVAIDAVFMESYQQVAEQDLWYNQLSTERPSKGASNIYPFLALFPRLRKWLGPRHLNNLVTKDYTLTNEDYEVSLGIKVNDVEDDNLGVYDMGIKQLGRSARLWPNDLVYAAIAAGGSTVCYDGQYFFDDDHPLVVPGAADTTQSNLHTGTALTAANYVTTRTTMATRKGEDGKPLGLRPGALIVPPSLEITAKRIVESDLAGYNQNSSSNATDTNVLKGTAKVIVIPDLEGNSSTTWYLADLSWPLKPFITQIRRAPNRVDVLDKPTDKDYFDSKLIKVGVDGRGAAGYALWQLIDKCTA